MPNLKGETPIQSQPESVTKKMGDITQIFLIKFVYKKTSIS
jgi:hypothetical protein